MLHHIDAESESLFEIPFPMKTQFGITMARILKNNCMNLQNNGKEKKMNEQN